jgi:hypothetical protein
VAQGDRDLCVRKSSVTDKIKSWVGGPTVQYVPVEFLSDQEAAAFGRYRGSVSQVDLERFFYGCR